MTFHLYPKQSIRPEVQMDWDMGDMSPMSPKNSFQKIFRYVAPRRRLENGRNLLSTDELACHGYPSHVIAEEDSSSHSDFGSVSVVSASPTFPRPAT